MKRKKTFLFLLSIAMTFIFCVIIQNADAKMRWKMTSTWTPDILGIESDKHFVEDVNKLVGDELEIKFFPGGALMPPYEVFDAVSRGSIQMSADGPLYWAGKNSAFEPLCALPLGLTSIDYMVWIHHGGGFELYQEVYGKFGMVYLPHGVNLESGIRSSKPIKSLSDFKGLKMRTAARTTGKVLKELGTAQTVLAGSELYTSLEKGVIDATEWSSPANDWGLGLQEVTKYWSTPPWHQPAVVYGVMINKKAFLLFEVALTIAVISLGLVFVIRSISTSLKAARSASLYHEAINLAYEKMFDLELESQAQGLDAASSEGIFSQNQNFSWKYSIKQIGDGSLGKLILDISWKEGRREGGLDVVTFVRIKE